MRTTIDIDDDILDTAKKIAAARRSSAGKVISDLVREALERPEVRFEDLEFRNGFPQFPKTGRILTVEMVEDLIEEEDREIIALAAGRK